METLFIILLLIIGIVLGAFSAICYQDCRESDRKIRETNEKIKPELSLLKVAALFIGGEYERTNITTYFADGPCFRKYMRTWVRSYELPEKTT